jgi:hypothetical protein
MMPARDTPPSAEQSDIVESDLLDILQTVVDARCGLSAIHQLLDGTKTMSEIRARFVQWQIHQRESE